MLEARGRFVLFTDADLSAPIDEADKLLQALDTYDVAIGSRALDRRLISVHQSRLRELAGIIFNLIVRVILRLPFVDTQCGFKAFRREPSRIIFQQWKFPCGGRIHPIPRSTCCAIACKCSSISSSSAGTPCGAVILEPNQPPEPPANPQVPRRYLRFFCPASYRSGPLRV